MSTIRFPWDDQIPVNRSGRWAAEFVMVVTVRKDTFLREPRSMVGRSHSDES